MSKMNVRLTHIEIVNFKNVKKGKLGFENARKPYHASILGLYGQNGSGKTALIDALLLLKMALTGREIPDDMANYINIDADHATIRYDFHLTDESSEEEFKVGYQLCIRKCEDDTVTTDMLNADSKRKTVVFNEVLSYSYKNADVKERMQPLIDTENSEAFTPATKYEVLTGKKNPADTDVLVARKMASTTSRAFIFSKELMTIITSNCLEEKYVRLFKTMVNYGACELFVINTLRTGMIALNALPFMYEEKSSYSSGSMMLPSDHAVTIRNSAREMVCKVTDNMNIVLTQLIPGLKIGVKELGTELLEDGSAGCKIQLMSKKNKKEIPLKYESEGIKKIVFVLQLLIVVYNQPSMTVAVDGMDSGVFEYLLGELLRIISEKGKGQLIFTSHNLRPLETLDRGFIAFTTVNPEDRYIRLSNIKSNNNLRDLYYKSIVPGEKNENLYNATNNAEIAFAFREAGMIPVV